MDAHEPPGVSQYSRHSVKQWDLFVTSVYDAITSNATRATFVRALEKAFASLAACMFM